MDQILRGLCLAVRAELLSGLLHPMLLASSKLFTHCKAEEAQDRAGSYSSLLWLVLYGGAAHRGDGLPEWHMIPSLFLLGWPCFTLSHTQG